ATNAPANISGVEPFTVAGDYSTPNEAYFQYADWVIQQAAARGIAVLLTPSYLGYDGGDEGWYSEMQANGTAKLEAYGRYVGTRFKNDTNIIWVQGGDYDPPDKSLVDAIAKGIAETDPGSIQTAHGAPETAALDYWQGYSWLALNNVYTYDDVFSP